MVIRRFDEVLTKKAGKSNLEELYDHLKANYIERKMLSDIEEQSKQLITQ